jgi:hypothetical protein
MTNRIRILKHEAVKDCGSFEVRFPDGRPVDTSIGTVNQAAGLDQTRWIVKHLWRKQRPQRLADAFSVNPLGM